MSLGSLGTNNNLLGNIPCPMIFCGGDVVGDFGDVDGGVMMFDDIVWI